MKKARAWITRDGVVHLSRERAVSHAEDRYGAALTKLAHEAVKVEKYVAMVGWLEDNIDRLVELEALKRDIDVEPDDE